MRRAKDRVLLDSALEALVWCGGSGDFAPEGKASVGWNNLVVPVIEALSIRLGYISATQRKAWFDRAFPGPDGAFTGTQRLRGKLRKVVRK